MNAVLLLLCPTPQRLQVARAGQARNFFKVVKHIYKEEGIKKFWQGLVPALILTLNPAINYAAFDAMKSILGRAKQRRPATKEILVLGLLSKFLATIITYPLIRAKVIMMADFHSAQEERKHGERGEGEDPKDMQLVHVLARTVREGGPLALYVGCDAQIINTAFKNSLLLLTKEQISRLVTFLFSMR